MVDQTTNAFFESLYDTTYPQIVLFVTKRCSDPTQIADIMQDIYADVYAVMMQKGCAYLQNPGAFVQHVAKKKLARYYGWKERLREMIPLFGQNREDDEEFETLELLLDDLPVVEQVEKGLLLSDIAAQLATKPLDVQRIFLLYYSLDMPIRRIAAELNLRESSVKNKLYRTIGELRRLYGKDEVKP